MTRTIPAVPLLRPRDFCARLSMIPPPLAGGVVSFWYSGRVAIFQMVKALGLRPGDRVLAPAYSCGSEIDALLRAGLEVDYYHVGPRLQPDLDHLSDLCRTPAQGVYVTHYFGFAQPMASLIEFAQTRGMLVLEDNAHGLYSEDDRGQPLGTLGDAAIFSLTKSLPVPDGGALILNREARAHPPRSRRPRLRAMAGRMKYLIKESLSLGRRATPPATAGVPPAPPGRDGRKQRGSPPSVMDMIRLLPERRDWGMSPIAGFLFHRFSHGEIRARRRANFTRLAGMIRAGGGAAPIFPSLPDGCCPNFFPLVVDEPTSLHRYLLAHGVHTKRTWSYFHDLFPRDRFPYESRLKNSVIAIPVHQDLDSDDMDRVAQVMADWQAGDAAAASVRLLGAGCRPEVTA